MQLISLVPQPGGLGLKRGPTMSIFIVVILKDLFVATSSLQLRIACFIILTLTLTQTTILTITLTVKTISKV